MKHLLSLVLLSFTFISCTRVETTHYPDGTLQSQLHYQGDELHGRAVWFYPNGQEREEFHYSHGLLDGMSRRWQVNGKLESEYYYVEGRKEGRARMWDSEGRLAIEEHWSRDTLHGPYREFHANGVVKVDGRFSRGLFEGTWTYRNETGQEVGRGDYVEGTGLMQSWYFKGGTERIIHYERNVKHGLEILLDEQGDTLIRRMYAQGELLWEE